MQASCKMLPGCQVFITTMNDAHGMWRWDKYGIISGWHALLGECDENKLQFGIENAHNELVLYQLFVRQFPQEWELHQSCAAAIVQKVEPSRSSKLEMKPVSCLKTYSLYKMSHLAGPYLDILRELPCCQRHWRTETALTSETRTSNPFGVKSHVWWTMSHFSQNLPMLCWPACVLSWSGGYQIRNFSANIIWHKGRGRFSILLPAVTDYLVVVPGQTIRVRIWRHMTLKHWGKAWIPCKGVMTVPSQGFVTPYSAFKKSMWLCDKISFLCVKIFRAGACPKVRTPDLNLGSARGQTKNGCQSVHAQALTITRLLPTHLSLVIRTWTDANAVCLHGVGCLLLHCLTPRWFSRFVTSARCQCICSLVECAHYCYEVGSLPPQIGSSREFVFCLVKVLQMGSLETTWHFYLRTQCVCVCMCVCVCVGACCVCARELVALQRVPLWRIGPHVQKCCFHTILQFGVWDEEFIWETRRLNLEEIWGRSIIFESVTHLSPWICFRSNSALCSRTFHSTKLVWVPKYSPSKSWVPVRLDVFQVLAAIHDLGGLYGIRHFWFERTWVLLASLRCMGAHVWNMTLDTSHQSHCFLSPQPGDEPCVQSFRLLLRCSPQKKPKMLAFMCEASENSTFF